MGKPPNKSFINWCLSSAGIYNDEYLATKNRLQNMRSRKAPMVEFMI